MLGLEDRVAIYELCARFAVTVDAHDPEALAALFTEHGTYHSIRRATGRDNLIELFKTIFAASRPDKKLRDGLHTTSMPVVSGADDVAKAVSHFLWTAYHVDAPPVPSGQPLEPRLGFEAGQPALLTAGMYQDTLRKVGGEWYFEYRRALMSVVPASDIPPRSI